VQSGHFKTKIGYLGVALDQDPNATANAQSANRQMQQNDTLTATHRA
jgi:hypothetical protein